MNLVEELIIPEGKTGILACMGKEGDIKVTWDHTSKDEVDAARAQFDSLKKKGYIAYKVEGPKGEKGEVLKEFDPHASRIILAPPMRGG